MKIFEVLFSRTGALALFALAALSACTVVVEDDGPRPRPPRPGPEYCTREYQPVCASRRGDRQTFTNSCMAERAGYRVIGFGECRRGGGGREEEGFCTREYRPVCATAGNVVQTFNNSCEARAAGFRVVGEGGC